MVLTIEVATVVVTMMMTMTTMMMVVVVVVMEMVGVVVVVCAGWPKGRGPVIDTVVERAHFGPIPHDG